MQTSEFIYLHQTRSDNTIFLHFLFPNSDRLSLVECLLAKMCEGSMYDSKASLNLVGVGASCDDGIIATITQLFHQQFLMMGRF